MTLHDLTTGILVKYLPLGRNVPELSDHEVIGTSAIIEWRLRSQARATKRRVEMHVVS